MLSLRDELAIERTKLANQRTLLAMLRTGLYLIIVSFTILSLPALTELKWLSGIIMALGVFTGFLGLILWNKEKKIIKSAYLNLSLIHI